MKNIVLRAAPALAIATLLAACGSGNQADLPPQTAAAVTMTTGPNMPVPDCAADGCHGLRIIDANAEAFRHDAGQRPEAPQS